jgi:sulfur carrier protein ThiS adenylyltransferase
MKISDISKHLSRFRAGIAGAGGLGSNCAASLARSGIGTLVIADFDVVESMNLTRQYYFASQVGSPKTIALKDNILKINPAVKVIIHNTRLTRENIPVIFEGCDVIVEAFDLAEMKEMLAETVMEKLKGIPLVMGSGLAGWGRNEQLKCRKIDDCLYVCGDESTEVTEEVPPLAPRVAIVANMQADTVVEILMKKHLPG